MSRRIIQPDYDDPLKYYRLTERFYGGNTSTGAAASRDWTRGGTDVLNMEAVHATAGGMGVMALRANTTTADETIWTQSTRDIGSARTGVIITVRLRPQAGAFSANTMFSFGIQGALGTSPLQATATDFVGIRHQSTIDGNVYAVVKTAAGAGNESVVSLGAIDAVNWHTYRLIVGASTLTGYIDGAIAGSIALGSNFDTGVTYGSAMVVHNEDDSAGASQRKIDTTLFDVIVPTGGW